MSVYGQKSQLCQKDGENETGTDWNCHYEGKLAEFDLNSRENENLDNENVRHRVESDWWTENGIDGIEEAPGGSVR